MSSLDQLSWSPLRCWLCARLTFGHNMKNYPTVVSLYHDPIHYHVSDLLIVYDFNCVFAFSFQLTYKFDFLITHCVASVFLCHQNEIGLEDSRLIAIMRLYSNISHGSPIHMFRPNATHANSLVGLTETNLFSVSPAITVLMASHRQREIQPARFSEMDHRGCLSTSSSHPDRPVHFSGSTPAGFDGSSR